MVVILRRYHHDHNNVVFKYKIYIHIYIYIHIILHNIKSVLFLFTEKTQGSNSIPCHLYHWRFWRPPSQTCFWLLVDLWRKSRNAELCTATFSAILRPHHCPGPNRAFAPCQGGWEWHLNWRWILNRIAVRSATFSISTETCSTNFGCARLQINVKFR